MKIKNILMPILAMITLLTGMNLIGNIYANEDERHEGGKKGERGGQYSVVENPLYKEECSSCHFLYPPGLLPARSWQDIMKNSGNHFGEDLSIKDRVKGDILSYLAEYSAEKTRTEFSNKILNSIGSGTPVRITETPYIAGKHRKIPTEVFKRPSIGSFSNCGGCHPGGAQGDFEEDRVSIPK